jgi:hypothetical protein
MTQVRADLPRADPRTQWHLDDWRDELRIERAADTAVLVAAAAGGVVFDLALRANVIGVGGVLAVVVAAAALLVTKRVTNPQAVGLAMASVAFGGWLAVRTSPWLLPLDIAAAAALLVLAASYARGGSILDATVPALVMRAIHAVLHGIAAPAFAWTPISDAVTARRDEGRDPSPATGAAVGRGVLIALPIVVVLGVLLASADAVFASFFRIHVPFTDAFAHLALIGMGAWALAGLLRVASAAAAPPAPATNVRLGRVEAFVVLGALDVLFGAFAVAQLVASSQGGKRVLDTAGLTYAQYARSGFFQLVAVAVITFAVLLLVRAATADRPSDGTANRATTVVSEVAIALTLVIVFVALRRLGLYERAYGLTQLRLYVRVAAWSIAAVFVLLGAAIAGVAPTRRWLPAAVGAVALTALFGLNVANPDAVVARHDLAFAAQGHRFDPAYLATLSDDAIPALMAGAARLPVAQRDALLGELRAQHCQPWRWRGWAAANIDRHRAASLLTALCPTVSHSKASIPFERQS